MAKCCICDRNIERDDAPVLAMGAAGNPRLLCEDCATLLDTATLGRNIEEIKPAIAKLSQLMANNDPDELTFSVVSELMLSAADRAKAIKEGSYDFSLDEEKGSEGLDEIPEELLETEEDKEQDRLEEEKNKKFDKFYNYVLIGACIGVGLFIIWKLLEYFGVL